MYSPMLLTNYYTGQNVVYSSFEGRLATDEGRRKLANQPSPTSMDAGSEVFHRHTSYREERQGGHCVSRVKAVRDFAGSDLRRR